MKKKRVFLTRTLHDFALKELKKHYQIEVHSGKIPIPRKKLESKIEEIHETMSKIHFDKENVSEEKVITAYKNINTMFIESGLEANYIYPEYNL